MKLFGAFMRIPIQPYGLRSRKSDISNRQKHWATSVWTQSETVVWGKSQIVGSLVMEDGPVVLLARRV